MSVADIIANELEQLGVSCDPDPESKGVWIEPIDIVPNELRERIVANKPELIAYLIAKRRLSITGVLEELRDVGLYRANGLLHMRYPNRVTAAHRQLLQCYHSALLDVLTPRGLTFLETQQLALWLHDKGRNSQTRP